MSAAEFTFIYAKSEPHDPESDTVMRHWYAQGYKNGKPGIMWYLRGARKDICVFLSKNKAISKWDVKEHLIDDAGN